MIDPPQCLAACRVRKFHLIIVCTVGGIVAPAIVWLKRRDWNSCFRWYHSIGAVEDPSNWQYAARRSPIAFAFVADDPCSPESAARASAIPCQVGRTIYVDDRQLALSQVAKCINMRDRYPGLKRYRWLKKLLCRGAVLLRTLARRGVQPATWHLSVWPTSCEVCRSHPTAELP